MDDERIRDFISGFRPQLVVIDPIQSYVENDSDLQIAVRARKLMRRISMWASTFNCAIVLIGHLSKRESSRELYRGLGSIDVVAAARSVLQVERDPEDKDIRIVRQIKNSLGPNGEDIHFEIRPRTGFHWLNTSGRVSDSIVQPEPEILSGQTHPESIVDLTPMNKHELAAALITKALADGPVESMEIKKLMAEHRIADKTAYEVKAELGIKSYRKLRVWYWMPPDNSSNPDNTEKE